MKTFLNIGINISLNIYYIRLENTIPFLIPHNNKIEFGENAVLYDTGDIFEPVLGFLRVLEPHLAVNDETAVVANHRAELGLRHPYLRIESLQLFHHQRSGKRQDFKVYLPF